MYLLDHTIECKSRSDRVELFPLYDCHIGKRNCAEDKLIAERREILKRASMPNRHVRILMGGDICDVIKPQDIRFDFNDIADWLYEGDAVTIREKLNDIATAQVKHAVHLFDPIRHLIIGNLEANHDKAVRKRYNTDTYRQFCKELNIPDMTDEAIIRFRFQRGKRGPTQAVTLYMRHGYGGGRTPGTEPNKIARMMGDGVAADCDICLTGHTHTYCNPEPIPVLYLPVKGKLPARLPTRYRFGLNPGCWLYSHLVGPGSYESAACYPTRAMMTCKIVIWPFWSQRIEGQMIERPKIELREYPIL
jgi:hypothetical protein